MLKGKGCLVHLVILHNISSVEPWLYLKSNWSYYIFAMIPSRHNGKGIESGVHCCTLLLRLVTFGHL